MIRVAYGVEAVYQTADARAAHTAYFRNVTNDNFIVTFEFSSWEDYTNAATWFKGYMDAAVDLSKTGISAMGVLVPVRNFYGVGIPVSGVSFGDSVGEITYVMTVEFSGASDSIAPTDGSQAALNDFGAPTSADPGASSLDASQYFFPWSTQDSSPYNAQDTALYDAPTPPQSSNIVIGLPPTKQQPSLGY